MCWGMQATEQKTGTTNSNTNATNSGQVNTTSTANPAIQSAAMGNLDFVKQLQANGFQGYGGQQVANMSGLQAGTLNNAGALANSPNFDTANAMIKGYAGAGPQSVSAGTITPQTIAQNMSPYMNQYVMQALAPQMEQMNINNAKTNQATNAQATSRGAFGDARQGVESANNSFLQNVQREGVIGNAYNNAFQQAISAGAQDTSNNMSAQGANVANSLAAQNANAGYQESALARALGGSQALQNSTINQMGVQTSANALGQQDTAQRQADLTANYNQWLMAQQYPFQTAQLANSTLGQSASAVPASTSATTNNTSSSVTNGTTVGTTEKPDNSGVSFLGTLASAFI